MYTTNQKLGLDTEQVVVMEDDFVSAMSVMVPSTLRVNDQHQMPLPTNVKPLLENTVANICTLVSTAIVNKLLSFLDVSQLWRAANLFKMF